MRESKHIDYKRVHYGQLNAFLAAYPSVTSSSTTEAELVAWPYCMKPDDVWYQVKLTTTTHHLPC